MKKIKLFLFINLMSCISIQAAVPYCDNLGFERGDFTNWVGYTWIYRTDTPSLTTAKKKGIITGRQTIMTDTTAYDSNADFLLKKIPKGSRYSARLGDAVKGGLFESLSYTMKVDSSNALLVWKFAVVLQNPLSNHTKSEEPRFRVSLIDQKGDTIPDCANYDVYASDAEISSSFHVTGPASNPILWRDWTTVGANLLAYLGQTITIEFMAADCTHSGHYGYAYFVAECHPLFITVQYCTGDTYATLTAPQGFINYKWVDNKGLVVGNAQSLDIKSPTEGSVFTCNMTSATGCTVSLSSTIAKYEPKASFTSSMIDCKSNTVQFTNASTASHGSLSYKWDFGNGKTSTDKNPSFTFATSGMHKVSLVANNPPSLCYDSIMKDVESFSPPLVGILGESTYCPKTKTVLKAFGAHHYNWSNGSKADSIEVGAPGGKIWMLGHSSTGCVSDTVYRTLKEEPDWIFPTVGTPLFCTGDSTKLSASGAVSYKWNTGSKSTSIFVKKPGIYTVSGANPRGCEKSVSFNVVEDPLPNVNFSLSSLVVDSRHNKLTCSIPAQAGVQYSWDMGDGSTEKGSTIEHAYNVSYTLLDYTITLTAKNTNACTNSSSKVVDIIPFIPNVFTPNNDGVNDLFMPGVEVQIFDRTGISVYKGTNGWNGKYNGKTVDNDTYFYLIYYNDKKKNVQTKKGYVTVKK